MELRLLRYFLMVAREQSFTKAAKQLHITQPTLSRQMIALEEELGCTLINRKGNTITLTDEGLLLKRRALEMISLEDQLLNEFQSSEEILEGTIHIGCGEFNTVEILAEICRTFKIKYPGVLISIHTGTADDILEKMNKGLIDIGVFLEPVNTEELEYIRMDASDTWVVSMKAEDPLAKKEYIVKEDLLDKDLILPERNEIVSELANWFGKDFDKVHISFTTNLASNAGIMTLHDLGYFISIEGPIQYWKEDMLVQVPLYPKMNTSTVIAYRRNLPYSRVVNKFIEEIKYYALKA